MQVKLEILFEGDSVLSAWDSHVAVKKESGEVEIFQYYLDEEGSAETVRRHCSGYIMGAAFHARKSELPGKIKKALGWSGKNE